MIYHIYTDGSTQPHHNQSGWAYVIRGNEDSLAGGKFQCGDSYAAELVAIIEALESIENPSKIIIHTDHLSLANAINTENRKLGKYPEYHNRLHEQCEKHDITVEHHKRNTDKWARMVHNTANLAARQGIIKSNRGR